MSTPGDNLPGFRSVQLDFAAHIRNPEVNPRPADVEPRRMQIYVDLFFNNIKHFLDSAFPVARKVLGEMRWRALAREFMHQHGSESPYFMQISEEFLVFLQQRGLHDLPGFLLELCHYEWVELALDVAADEIAEEADTTRGSSGSPLQVSALVRALVYSYPVHRIGADFQPQQAPDVPTYLLVYRTPELQVRFMESNPLTHRLLEVLRQEADADAAFIRLQQELAEAGRDVALSKVVEQGKEIVDRFLEAGIIVGQQRQVGKTDVS